MIIKLYRIEQETSTNQSSQLPLRLLKEMGVMSRETSSEMEPQG